MEEKESKIDNGMQEVQIPTPKQLYEVLNKYVIGQDKAKKVLSVAIYNHYKRFMINVCGVSPKSELTDDLNDVVVEKSNVLMLGNTGTGKTFMVKTLANHLGLPCYIADSTKLTESGFVGDDVETVLTGLLHAANGDIFRAQNGIVLLDEVDKLGRRGENASLTRDVGGEGVQQGLLKIVEGTKVGVPPNGGRKHPEQQLIEFDTTNVLFIGLGAFDGIEKIIERRHNTKSIGFTACTQEGCSNNNKLLDKVTQGDLKKFGLIPELIGRFPIITHTNPLSENDLVKILKEPKNSILKQYQKMMLIDGINLSFDEKALKLIGKIANETKTGARGLRSMLETVLTEIMFEFGGNTEVKEIKINSKYVENSLGDKYNISEIKKKTA